MPWPPLVPPRETLEVECLLRYVPPRVQAVLTPDLLALRRTQPFTDPLPVQNYTWPNRSGVWRPRYSMAVLKMKTLERLCSKLHDELHLGVTALGAPESALPRPMRNALLVMQGRRLGQLCEMLTRWLEPEEILLLFRQELAARAPATAGSALAGDGIQQGTIDRRSVLSYPGCTTVFP